MIKKFLLAYTINGQTVGVDLPSWNSEDLNGNEPFMSIISGDTIPTGYMDISSIIHWNQFGNIVSTDYLSIKSQIKELCDLKGWSNLSDAEKDLSIQYYCYEDSIDAVIYLMTVKGMTQEQAQGYLMVMWHKHHGGVMNTCKQRWYYVKFIVPQYLDFLDAEDLLNNIESLVTLLNDIGRQGINYGDKKEGIMDYIESTNSYVGKGLRESGYSLLIGTWDEFILELKNVLVEGIYNKYTDFEIN
jgi:hypothetical protein